MPLFSCCRSSIWGSTRKRSTCSAIPSTRWPMSLCSVARCQSACSDPLRTWVFKWAFKWVHKSNAGIWSDRFGAACFGSHSRRCHCYNSGNGRCIEIFQINHCASDGILAGAADHSANRLQENGNVENSEIIISRCFDHNPDHNHDANTVKGTDRISQKHPFIKIKWTVLD